MKLGDINLTDLKLGTTQVNKVMLGSQQVWVKAQDDQFIYVQYSYFGDNVIRKLSKLDYSVIAETPIIPDTAIATVGIDTSYVYVYIINEGTKRYNKSDMSFDSVVFSAAIDARFMYFDSLYMYVGSAIIKKYLKSDFSFVGETPSYGSYVSAVVFDNDRVYVGGQIQNTCKVYSLADMSYIGQTPTFSGQVHSIAVDSTHIYLGYDSTLRKHNKADFSFVQSVTNSSTYGLTLDDTYIYSTYYGITSGYIRKFTKDTLTFQAQSVTVLSIPREVVKFDDLLYVRTDGSSTVDVYLASDMSAIIDTSIDNAFQALDYYVDNTHIYLPYIGGVVKYLKSDFTFVARTAISGALSITGNAFDIFVGTTNGIIYRVQKSNMYIVNTAYIYNSGVSGNVRALTLESEEILYASCGQHILKLKINPLSPADDYYIGVGATVEDIITEGDYIYITSKTSSTAYIQKYHKDSWYTDGVLNQVSFSIGSSTFSVRLAVDNDYMYIGTRYNNSNVIVKYLKSDFSYVGISPTMTFSIRAIAVDESNIYVGGETTTTTSRTIRQYDKSTLAYVGQTGTITNTVRSIQLDSTHIYAAGDFQTVRKYLKSTRAFVAETDTRAQSGVAMKIDNTHIYAGSISTQTVRQYLKSDMSFVAQTSGVYGANPTDIYLTDTHLFVGGNSPTSTVRKYLKSDITGSYVESPPYRQYTSSSQTNLSISRISVNADKVYYGGTTTGFVYQVRVSDLKPTHVSFPYGGLIYALAQDDTHIYAGGATVQKVKKYLKSNIIEDLGLGADYGGQINSIIIDGDYQYVAGVNLTNNRKVRRYLKDTQVLVDESADYGGIIYRIVSDTTHVYIAGNKSNAVVRKLLKSNLSFVGDTQTDKVTNIPALAIDSTHIYAKTLAMVSTKFLKSDLSVVIANYPQIFITIK